MWQSESGLKGDCNRLTLLTIKHGAMQKEFYLFFYLPEESHHFTNFAVISVIFD